MMTLTMMIMATNDVDGNNYGAVDNDDNDNTGGTNGGTNVISCHKLIPLNLQISVVTLAKSFFHSHFPQFLLRFR